MPYITKEDRSVLDAHIDNLIRAIRLDNLDYALSGASNYAITRILDGVFAENRYDKINSAIGVLECAKLEFYRRRAVNYEDEKMFVNGDAYSNPPQPMSEARKDMINQGRALQLLKELKSDPALLAALHQDENEAKYHGRRLSKQELALIEKHKDALGNPSFKSNLPSPKEIVYADIIITKQHQKD